MIRIQYFSEDEKEALIKSNVVGEFALLVEENLREGNFLTFGKIVPKPPTLEEQLAEKNQQIQLLEAQNQALSERADFIEDVVAEMAAQVYQ